MAQDRVVEAVYVPVGLSQNLAQAGDEEALFHHFNDLELRRLLSLSKKVMVSSIDQRNSFGQHSARGSKAKGFPRPAVESEGNRIEIILAVDGQLRSLGEILA